MSEKEKGKYCKTWNALMKGRDVVEREEDEGVQF